MEYTVFYLEEYRHNKKTQKTGFHSRSGNPGSPGHMEKIRAVGLYGPVAFFEGSAATERPGGEQTCEPLKPRHGADQKLYSNLFSSL